MKLFDFEMLEGHIPVAVAVGLFKHNFLVLVLQIQIWLIRKFLHSMFVD